MNEHDRMNSGQIVSLGLLCILGIFAIYIMAKTPVIRSFFRGKEGFTTQTVSTAQCPYGSRMYMYDGKAYCCNGTINTDAYNLEKTCITPVTQPGNGICTLGPATVTPLGTTIQNCGGLIGSILTNQSTAICPPSKPNFCTANRCCQSAITADGSDCVSKANGTYCEVGDTSQLFFSTTECNYLRMKEKDTCPSNTSKGDVTVTTGALSGMTLYGCSNQSRICYTDTVITTLQRMGKDTSSLTACSSPNAMSSGSCG